MNLKTPKSPVDHAIAHFMLSISITAIIAGFSSALVAILGNTGVINWRYICLALLIGIIASLGNSIAAYLRALPEARPGDIDIRQIEPLIPLIVNGIEARLREVLSKKEEPS